MLISFQKPSTDFVLPKNYKNVRAISLLVQQRVCATFGCVFEVKEKAVRMFLEIPLRIPRKWLRDLMDFRRI